MSVTLTNRPPTKAYKRFIAHNKVSSKCNSKGDPITQRLILMNIGKIKGMLDAFHTIATEGNMTITIGPGSYSLEGELVCYSDNQGRERDAWLREIDKAVFCLREEFGPQIEEASFTFEQTCEFKT